MILVDRLPGRLRFFLPVLALYLVAFTGVRIAFWITFRSTAPPVPLESLLKSFFVGLRLDLRLALLLLLPALALSWVPRIDPTRSSSGRRFWVGHFTLLTLLVLLFYSIDFGHYAYLEERVEISALRFLQNPLISLGMVWESYPVMLGIGGLLLVGMVLYVVLGRLMSFSSVQSGFGSLGGWGKTFVVFVSVAAFLFGLYGKASHYPLRWSDAFFSTHRLASDLALNPVLFFVDTWSTAEERTFDREQVKGSYDWMASYLGVERPDPEKLSFLRHTRPTAIVKEPVNVVVILLESFSAHKTGAFGNPLDASPNFDAIARQSLLFTRFYTPRHGTARAVFATLTGIPDVSSYRTASRNPQMVSQQTILDALKGYEKFYFLGGSANWANIRGLFSNNVEGLRIFEEGDYEAPRVDVWGISDLHLFEAANRVLSEVRDKPFFAIIHTAGNHKPYTIPDDSRGFESIEQDGDELIENGFRSLGEYNSFRLLDHSLGQFMQMASDAGYLDHTLLVLLGDNGTPGRMPNLPKAEEALEIGTYHVPLAIYAPGLIHAGKVYDVLANQMDVMPTIAGIAGWSLPNTTMGRNLFDSRFDGERYAFILRRRGAVAELGLLGSNYYLEVSSDGTDARLHSYRSDNPTEDVGERLPEKVREMTRVGMGFYHTAKYLMYHNSRRLYAGEALEHAASASPAVTMRSRDE